MSKKRFVLLAGLLAAVVAGGRVWTADAPDSGGPSIPIQVDIAAGKALYAANCAACHGADLEGQENWQSPGPDGRLPAPPHDETGHTWHHGDRLLFVYTKFGGQVVMAARGIEFDSGMPGFGDQLSDEEIWNILEFIKSTWPERIREMQAVRTEAETLSTGN